MCVCRFSRKTRFDCTNMRDFAACIYSRLRFFRLRVAQQWPSPPIFWGTRTGVSCNFKRSNIASKLTVTMNAAETKLHIRRCSCSKTTHIDAVNSNFGHYVHDHCRGSSSTSSSNVLWGKIVVDGEHDDTHTHTQRTKHMWKVRISVEL